MTAVELGITLPIVCVDNGGYGEIRANMEDRSIEPLAVDLQQPNWVALAEALGARGTSATTDDVADRVLAALEADGPTLIHLPIAKSVETPTV